MKPQHILGIALIINILIMHGVQAQQPLDQAQQYYNQKLDEITIQLEKINKEFQQNKDKRVETANNDFNKFETTSLENEKDLIKQIGDSKHDANAQDRLIKQIGLTKQIETITKERKQRETDKNNLIKRIQQEQAAQDPNAITLLQTQQELVSKKNSPVEINFLYYKEKLIKEQEAELTLRESLLNAAKGTAKESTARTNRNNAAETLKRTREEAYKIEKKARIAQYSREAQEAESQIGKDAQEIEELSQKLEAALAKPNPDSQEVTKITELRKKLDEKTHDAAIQKKRRDLSLARLKYEQGQSSYAQKLTDIIEAYNEFSGLGAYASLFITDKDLAKRRDEANELFCNTYILGGIDCYTSKLCQMSVDANLGGLALITRTQGREIQATAHIEADKSLPITFLNATTNTQTTQRLYRITYYLNNPTDNNLNYNIIFKANDGNNIRAFTPDKQLGPGSSTSQLRANAIVKYSNRDYTEVCLIFNPKIQRLTGGSVDRICNSITEYTGGATSITTNTQASQSGSTSQTSATKDFEGF